ncbi:acetylserotonin O-methyltransferase isoform X2 [Stegostoma tigrinum]|uniref:acetylserotonin O-methyltransferase isoform X2 n=1 Tax=Stegostoma tigrinum TaxID=3053191 RepID=UPI00202ADBDB|nr:acetylserotonin O-methyltransferase isoform X2 [Stegostoma tigrinum]
MELSKQELEYPQKLLNYMDGFLISKTMFAACELGVFDLLENEGALPSNAVAERLGTSTDGMDRLLTACVGLQLLQVKQHQGEVLYSNTDLSQVYLTKASPRTLYYSMAYYSQTIYHCFAFLNDAVRSEEEMLKFMQLMNSIWNICGKDVVVAFDLSIFTHIVDLGGCTGAIAKECISAYPQSTVTIYDLPKVLEMARNHFVSPHEKRITFHEGDFFKDPIPDADLYILARIIHDWTEDKCLKLLNRVNKTCKPGSGVLLIEALLNEDRTGPVTAQLYSLNMLVQTEGKERMASEYINLLESAGFKDVQVQRTGKIYDVILGRK